MPALKKNPDGTPHVHMFRRVDDKNPNREVRYFCTHPDCGCIKPRTVLNGKRTICGICKTRETVFDKENLRRETPRCVYCSTSKKAAAVRDKVSEFDKLFGEAIG